MGLILLYHRVSDLKTDPQRLAVSPNRFSEQLEILKTHFDLIPLATLIEHATRNTMPPNAVSITFDDGYGDNLEHAKPLLERYGVPATVFVATSYIDGDREFWWDDLERLLLREGKLPRLLRLKLGQKSKGWDLGSASTCDADASVRHADWNVEHTGDPTPRHRAYRDLCGILRTLSISDRDAALRELARQAQGTLSPRPTHRPLRSQEVRRLCEGGLVEVGAHSANHPALSALPIAAQEDEILSSKRRVEALTGRQTSAFAYPFGTAADYSPATIKLVREAGFTCACAATPGRVGLKTDLLQLPRVIVRDWDARVFQERLKGWQ